MIFSKHEVQKPWYSRLHSDIFGEEKQNKLSEKEISDKFGETTQI